MQAHARSQAGPGNDDNPRAGGQKLLALLVACAVLGLLVGASLALAHVAARSSHRHVSRSERIDARLRKLGTRGRPALVKPGARELPAMRTAQSDTFVNPDGTRVLRSFAVPVNYRDARGRFRPSDNRHVPSLGGFRNRANSFTAQLPGDLSQPIRVADGSAWVSYALAGGRGHGVARGAVARFRAVRPSVDAAYTAQSSGLKETLTLRARSSASTYVYRVSMSRGITARRSASGAIDFVDRSGRPRFTFAPPFAYDRRQGPDGAPAHAVSMRLRRTGRSALVTVAVNRRWLRARGRAFPVTVDPSVYHWENRGDTRTRFTGANQDCYIKDGSYAATNWCGGTEIHLGWHGGVQRRMLLQFNVQSQLPSRTKVLDAEFGLNLSSESGTGSSQVELHRVTRAWTTGATWNSYDGTNAWTTAGGDYDANVAASNTINTPGWYTWYPKSLVQGWVNGSIQNQGLLVKQTTERSLDNDYYFVSSEGSSSYWPYIDVVYEPQTGQPGYYHYASQQLTDKGSLGVNVASGNLMLQNNDLHIAGTDGMDLSVNRFFNHQWERSTQDLGTGWVLGLGADVSLRFLTDGTAVFDGPSGYEVDFAKNNSGTYTSPSGIDGTLCSVSVAGSGACPSDTGAAYALTMHPDERRYNFDSSGKLISEQDRNGNKIAYTYASGKLSQITDTKGHITSVAYNATGQIGSITDSTNRAVSYGYTVSPDWGYDLTSYTDANGKTTQYAYGTSSDDVTQVTDPNGNVTKIAYDASDHVQSITRVTDSVAGTGPTTSFSYQSVSAPCGSGDYGKTVVTDPDNNQTTYCFDSMGKVTKVQDALGHSRSTSYDSYSNVRSESSALGNTWTSSFDTSADSNGNTSHNWLNTTAPSVGGLNGAQASATYNNAAQKYQPDTVTDAQTNKWSASYDQSGNLSGQSNNGLSPANVVSTDHNGQTTPAACSRTTDTGPKGTLRCSKDGNGHETYYNYDTSGNLSSVVQPGGSCSTPRSLCTSATYDTLNRLATLTDGKAQQTTFTYDKLDRVTQVKYADGSTVNYSYDGDGNLTQRIDPRGTTTYSYDKLNRRTQDAYPYGTNNTNNYTYDAAGNLLTMTDAGGTVTYGYDQVNRLCWLLVGSGSGTCSAPPSGASTFTYDSDNNRLSTSFPNGITETRTYDGADRLKTVKATKGATTLTNFTYSYGCNNVDHDIRCSVTDVAGNSTSYAYDGLNRLTSANTNKAGGGTDNYGYGYDAASNMTSQTHNGAVTSMGYNQDNQLCWKISGSQASSACSAPTGATTYSYDAEGNLTGESDGRVFGYNAANQTTHLVGPGGSPDVTATYAGTGQGEMATKGGDSYTYNQLGMSSLTNGFGTFYFTREPDGNVIGERQAGGGSYYLLKDGHASVTTLTDSAGAVSDSYTYDPFGEELTGGDGPVQPWRFASQYLSTTLDLYKVGARFEHPNVGNWTQQDIVNDPFNVRGNRYIYAGDDPVNLSDPAGTCFILDCSTYHDIGNGISSGADSAYNEGKYVLSKGKELKDELDKYNPQTYIDAAKCGRELGGWKGRGSEPSAGHCDPLNYILGPVDEAK